MLGLGRTTVFTSGTVGLTAGLINAAVLLLLVPLSELVADFGQLAGSIGLGQYLATAVLGGATMLATLVLPLRLTTVFWGPRAGRYFDQVVLSGVSPWQMLIGKAFSQNAFLALIVLLTLPYLIFIFTLGDVPYRYLLVSLILIFVYCIELAIATLCLSLYVNELLAAGMVVVTAGILLCCGFHPETGYLFVLTPVPILWQSMGKELGNLNAWPEFWPLAAASITAMTLAVGLGLIVIAIGPLYGIIRENSAFGEIVRPGDRQRKRWARIRPHIQRSSELAFLYENRGTWFRASEAFWRWGIKMVGLVALIGAIWCWYACFSWYAIAYRFGVGGSEQLSVMAQVSALVIHSITLVAATILFSHAMNSTFLRLPFFRGRQIVEVARLDTLTFLFTAVLSSAATLWIPVWIDLHFAFPRHLTLFYIGADKGITANLLNIALEGNLMVTLMGLVVYTFHRAICLTTWLRTLSVFLTAALYLGGVFALPVLLANANVALDNLYRSWPYEHWTETLAVASPYFAFQSLIADNLNIGYAIRDELISADATRLPFYALQIALLVVFLWWIRVQSRRVRRSYMATETMCMVLLSTCLGAADADEFPDVDWPSVAIETAAGWEGSVVTSAPVPISFLLRNDSEQQIEGHIVLSSPEDNQTIPLETMTLSPHVPRRFATLANLSDWSECYASLVVEGRVMWRRCLYINGSAVETEDARIVLTVHPAGRSLRLADFQNLDDASGEDDSNADVIVNSAHSGRLIDLKAKPWQLPNHTSPLCALHAIVLADNWEDSELNRVQYRVLAEWICQGGQLFLSNQSSKIRQQLVDSSTFVLEPPSNVGRFTQYQLGLGAIYEYPAPLFGDSGKELRQELAQVITALPRCLTNEMIATCHERSMASWPQHIRKRSESNVLLMLGLCLTYGLLSGIVVLGMFRRSSKTIWAYTVTIVALASVAAGSLGHYVRTCPGDLNWATLTCVGHGGSVQFGTICMYSSGGQQSQVTVRGNRVDLQEYGPLSLHRLRYLPASTADFVWQPNRLVGQEDVYQLNASLLPFGTRLMRTTAVVPDGNRMEFKLDYVPNADATSSTRPTGTLKVTLDNRLATDLADCWLVIAGTAHSYVERVPMKGIELEGVQMRQAGAFMPQGVGLGQVNVDDRFVMWHNLGAIRAGSTYSDKIDAAFSGAYVNTNFYERNPSVSPTVDTPIRGLALPFSLMDGSAAILGQLRGSPEIKIDTEQTDFVPTEGIHYFFQSIAPEDMSQSLKEALRQWQRTGNSDDAREEP